MSNYPPGLPEPEKVELRFRCPECEEEWNQPAYSELGASQTLTEPICPNSCGIDPEEIPF